jgi:hypothetical protein
MDRLLVVRSVQFRPEDTTAPPKTIENLGISLVHLMSLSGRSATGVRANIRVHDRAALTELASYYGENTRLEWTFEIGGSGGSFSVVLRWTKFDRLTGRLQVVRTAVLRDLIADIEQDTEDPDPNNPPTEPAPPNVEDRAAPTAPQRTDTSSSCKPETDSLSSMQALEKRVSDLWTRLVGSKKTPGSRNEL